MTGYKRYHSHCGTCQRLHDVTPEQFERLLDLIPEPYASMVFVAVWTGLRVSELIGLKWDDVGTDSLTVDERCCRGDWRFVVRRDWDFAVVVNRSPLFSRASTTRSASVRLSPYRQTALPVPR
jgi:Phage integrase family